jgi:hypothetical protein
MPGRHPFSRHRRFPDLIGGPAAAIYMKTDGPVAPGDNDHETMQPPELRQIRTHRTLPPGSSPMVEREGARREKLRSVRWPGDCRVAT